MGLFKNFQDNGSIHRTPTPLTRQGQDLYVANSFDESPDTQLGLELKRRQEESERFGKIFTTNPGLTFLRNQVLLDQLKKTERASKVFIEEARQTSFKKAVRNLNLEKLKSIALEETENTAKLIGSILAQVPVNGTGTHFVRAFRGDQSYLGDHYAPVALSTRTFLPIRSEEREERYDQDDKSILLSKEASFNQDTALDPTQQLERTQRKIQIADSSEELLSTQKAQRYKKEVRVNLGDPGRRSIKNADGTLVPYGSPSVKESTDLINYLSPQSSIDIEQSRDLVKFRFKVRGKYLHFRAYITSFDDSYSGNWSMTNYIGRGEDFYTYKNFSRDLSVDFKIAPSTRAEMKPLYQKITYLASATAPTYFSTNFMGGTVSEVTIGDYVVNYPVIITDVRYNWKDGYPWEIAMNEPENGLGDTLMKELPMILECSVRMKVLHRFIPETGQSQFITGNQLGSPEALV